MIPEAYRTLANAQDYVFNLGEQRSTFFAQTGAEVQYDQKNGLWRLAQLQRSEKDTIGKDNRDPWVYQFSNEAIKDIKYDSGKASSPDAKTASSANLSQKENVRKAEDIRTTKYVAENVHDFTRNYTSPYPVF